jgi:hypothetical protein
MAKYFSGDAIHFKKFNISSALYALAALEQGFRVSISDVEPDFRFLPELSSLHPMSLSAVPAAYRAWKGVYHLSGLFPQLFFPQRVIALNEAGTIDVNAANLFDKLLKRERENSSLPLKLSKYPSLRALNSSFDSAMLVYEYRFDRQQALNELYRMCISKGAVLTKGGGNRQTKQELLALPFQHEDYVLFGEADKWKFDNSLRYETDHFTITAQKVADQLPVHFYLKKHKAGIDALLSKAEQAFQGLQLDWQPRHKEALHKLIEKQQALIPDDELLYDGPLSEWPAMMKINQRKISRQLGVKLKWKSIPGKEASKRMSGQLFRQIEQECNEKFDLARQSGLSYAAFSLLFYRYRSHIDEMIDTAYELMQHQRDPETIWKQAEEKVIATVYRREL